jgi:hypothetical protein
MPAFLIHMQQPVEGMVRSQSLSPARLIFLIALVVFFTVLFVVVYVWMRKPGFGQQEGHQPAISKRVVASDGRPALDRAVVPPSAVMPHAEDADGETRTAHLADVTL